MVTVVNVHQALQAGSVIPMYVSLTHVCMVPVCKLSYYSFTILEHIQHLIQFSLIVVVNMEWVQQTPGKVFLIRCLLKRFGVHFLMTAIYVKKADPGA